MAYMKIDCDYCGGSWEVYERDYKNQVSKFCPHCSKGIPEPLWSGVVNAFDSFVGTNCELFKESVSCHLPLFQVDFVSDNVFKAYREGRDKRRHE